METGITIADAVAVLTTLNLLPVITISATVALGAFLFRKFGRR